MAEIGQRLIADAPGAGFAERHVDADGFRIRYLEAGQGRRWCTCMAPAALGSAAPTTAGRAFPGDRLRGARLRRVSQEPALGLHAGACTHHGSGGHRPGPRPCQPDGDLVRRHARPLAGGAAPRPPRRAGAGVAGRHPTRSRRARRHVREWQVARELIVDIDADARRLVWAVVGGRLTHHNASMQIFADGAEHSRAVWIADLLPHELAADIGAMMEQGMGVIKQTLER